MEKCDSLNGKDVTKICKTISTKDTNDDGIIDITTEIIDTDGDGTVDVIKIMF